MNTELNKFNPNAVINTDSLNHGAVAIEQSRAVTEAQGKLILAKQFPRNINESYLLLIDSCSRPGFASTACYAFPRGGKTVTGASIRLAEEIARIYGNIEFGLKELSNVNGESEMEAYAWDLQTNVLSSQKFKVKHERKAYGKTNVLTDSRDIYELTANMGARRLRSRLLSILPPDLVESALIKCQETIRGESSIPLADRIKNMVKAFSEFGVTQKLLETKFNSDVSDFGADEINECMNIYNSLKSKMTVKSDWFIFNTESKPQKNFNPKNEKVDKKVDVVKKSNNKEFDPSKI